MPPDISHPSTQILATARLLRDRSLNLCQRAQKAMEEAIQTCQKVEQAQTQAETICLDVGLKITLLQMVRQVVSERNRRQPQPQPKRPRPRPFPVSISSEQEAWKQFYQLSSQTDNIQ